MLNAPYPASADDLAAHTHSDASLLQTVEARLEAKIEACAANALSEAFKKFESMIVALCKIVQATN